MDGTGVGAAIAHACPTTGRGLETRLGHAEKKLAALTPPRGRGKRQITDETALAKAIDTVLQDHRVHGLLSVAWEKQIERKTQYVGRGRGAASRQQRGLETVRYHITRIARQGDTITALTQRFGWKAFVTNAVHTRLSLQEGCCVTATNTVSNASSIVSRAASISRRCLSSATSKSRPHVPADARRPSVDGPRV